MTYTPAVKQLTTMEQAGERPCFWTPGWVDGLAISANTAAAYNVTTMRSNAGLAAGAPFYLLATVDSETTINFNNTAAAITTKTDGSGGVMLHPSQEARMFYVDQNITSISFFSVAGGTVSLEVYKT